MASENAFDSLVSSRLARPADGQILRVCGWLGGTRVAARAITPDAGAGG
jgi:hypothetical protein